MYIVVSCRWRTAAGTHDLWRTEPTNDIRLNQVNRDCVTVTHTHLYINNHSPSTQFIYILFVPFHLSTCRNNPVRVRNIIEVFFFLSSFHHRIFSNEVVCSNGTLEEKTGNKDVSPYVGSKPRCCWSESGCVFKWVLLWGRSQHNRIRTEHIVTERICDSIPSLRSVDTTTLNGHERRPIR